MKVPPLVIENPELTHVFPLKPGLDKNMATHASPTARNFIVTGDLSRFWRYVNMYQHNYELLRIDR